MRRTQSEKAHAEALSSQRQVRQWQESPVMCLLKFLLDANDSDLSPLGVVPHTFVLRSLRLCVNFLLFE